MADLVSVYSNHLDLPFTPDELRKLAVRGDRDDGLSEAVPYRAHELSKRLGKAKVDELVQRSLAGESAQSLAKELGVAPSALVRMLRQQGLTIQKRKVSQEEERALTHGYQAGATMAELEKGFGLSHGAVLRALHRSGIEMRARAPRSKRA